MFGSKEEVDVDLSAGRRLVFKVNGSSLGSWKEAGSAAGL